MPELKLFYGARPLWQAALGAVCSPLIGISPLQTSPQAIISHTLRCCPTGLCCHERSYAAVLAAYGDVASRISAAISRQQRHPLEAHVIEATSPCADVRVDHHMLAAAIQTQVGGATRAREEGNSVQSDTYSKTPAAVYL